MKKNKFEGYSTNVNRSQGGSNGGSAGRKAPIDLAKRLNADAILRKQVCLAISKKPSQFKCAFAGKDVESRVESVVAGARPVPSKTNLRIEWKDGTFTNIRVKNAKSGQIHLGITENFIEEFESQFSRKIPSPVKTALLLFTGRHPDQKKILDSIPVNFVGDRIRDLERKYNNRLTLASMYGYDEDLADTMMAWFRANIVDLMSYCFSLGASKERELTPEYVWLYAEGGESKELRIYSIGSLCKNLASLKKADLVNGIRPNDHERVGSTIAFPFGNLQYHLHSLQFRYDPEKIEILSRIVVTKNKFGSRPKKNGHQNEVQIAELLNSDKQFRAHFCDRVGRDAADFVKATAEGEHARKEESVLGGKTTGKTDITVSWRSGANTNISIKMCPKGQVYLVSAKQFVNVYEAQYGVVVPSRVRRALMFFVGEDPESRSILDATDISVDGEEARKQAYESNYRLMFNVIRNYDERMADELLNYLKVNIVNVSELCFAAGAVKDRGLWSELLWYKNLVEDKGSGLDYMIPIAQLKAALMRNGSNNEVVPGLQNAGSAIHLPFGWVQYHKKVLQFHHKLCKIQQLVASR